MAEALAVIGAVTAILQIAGAATKFSQTLYRTAHYAGSAKEDIQAFAMDIGAFASVIRVAHDAIRGHCEKESNSAVLQFVRDHKILRQLVEQSGRIRKRIEAVRPRIQELRGKFSMINRWKWVLKRPEVKALHPEMECVKTNLLVVMHVVALELAQQGEQSDATRREIKSLKRQIEVHIETINILQEKQRRASPARPRNDDRSAANSISWGQSSLIQLAESMVENGQVPEFENTYSRTESTSSLSSWGDEIETASENIPNTFFALQNPSENSSSSSFWGPESVPAVEIISNSENSVYVHNPSNILQPTGSAVSRNSAIIQVDEIEKEETIPLEITKRVPVVNASMASAQLVEGDNYLAVRPAAKILHLNTESLIEEESGYVTTRRSNGNQQEITITAILDRDLEGNIVSQEFAIRNDLEIEQLEEEDGVWVEFETDIRKRSTGQVVLEWSKEDFHHHPFRVRCWVVAYSGRPVYFGKPFLEKKDYYWGTEVRHSLR